MAEDKTYTLKELKDILTTKQKIFCHEYIIDWNTTRSYKKAYVLDNSKTASAAGSRMLGNVRIQQYINYIRNNFEEESGISKLRNLKELSKIAYSSIAHLHNTWIELAELEELKENNPDAVDAIESTESKTEYRKDHNGDIVEVKYIKIKLHPKQPAINEINRMMAYNAPDKVDHSSSDGSMSPIANLSTDELIKRADALERIDKKTEKK